MRYKKFEKTIAIYFKLPILCCLDNCICLIIFEAIHKFINTIKIREDLKEFYTSQNIHLELRSKSQNVDIISLESLNFRRIAYTSLTFSTCFLAITANTSTKATSPSIDSTSPTWPTIFTYRFIGCHCFFVAIAHPAFIWARFFHFYP